MVHYKLFYFPFKGLGEPVRLLLTHAKVEFEDIRVSSDEWPKHKEDMPMGQMPVLEVDGKKLCQSVAIGRYLAEKYNMMPKDPWMKAKADEMVLGWVDMWPKFLAVFSQPDKEHKKMKFDENMKEFIYPRLQVYEDYFAESKSGLIADQICWADYYVYHFIKMVEYFWNPEMTKYTHVKKFLEKVESEPTTKAWIEKYRNEAIAPPQATLVEN